MVDSGKSGSKDPAVVGAVVGAIMGESGEVERVNLPQKGLDNG